MTYQDPIGQPIGNSQRRLYEFIKKLFDIVVALTALIFLSPALLIISILIMMDSPGPIFYRQTRIGRWGKPFYYLRFRTTKVASDQEQLRNLRDKSESAFPKLDNDPRVTRLGMFLRKTSINELPQLFNVLRGEMSLVGPRPPLAYEQELYQDWHKRRFEVMPGITGLWQVQGSSDISFDEMVKLDIWCIDHRSFWLDLKILLETVSASLLGQRAY